MNAPTRQGIPFAPDVAAVREAALRSLARAAINVARNAHHHQAANSWPDDRLAELVTRGAVEPTALNDIVTLQTIAVYFIASLVPVSAAAAIFASSLKLTFGNAASINVPSLELPHAAWVAEGAAIPCLQGTSSPGALIEPTKVAALLSLSGELIRGSNAEQIMEQKLRESAAAALDAALFTTNPAVPGLRPAGILANITPIVPTAAASAFDAMVKDLGNIAASIAPAAGASTPVLVAAPRQAVALAMSAPRDLWPTVVSATLPDKTVIGIVPAGIATSISAPRIEASTAAAVHHEDATPADISDIGGVLAYPVKSTFQIDSVNLKLVQPATWGLRSPTAVAWLQNVNW
jgi:hypothetical protein